MEAFALEVLDDAKSWNWRSLRRLQQSGNQTGKFEAVSADFLYWLIKESQSLRGTVLCQFWETVGNCDNRLKDNRASHSFTSERQGLIPMYS